MLKGLLIDLDGVLFVEDEVIPGALDAVRFFKKEGFVIRFVTNTTTKPVKGIYQKLLGMGFPVEIEEVITTPRLAVDYLKTKNISKIHLITNKEIQGDFVDFNITEREPEAIVIGDIGGTWDYNLINRLFRMVIDGAEIVALHKGKYWKSKNGLLIDIGFFVAGLEYSTGQEAVVIGKPSKPYFNIAVASTGLNPKELAMIGDDIVNDVAGAKKAGIKGILVRTGKYNAELVKNSGIEPDEIFDSIKDVVA